jgi:hypothetical protein
MPPKSPDDLCVLTRITDDNDPEFDERVTLIDTLAGIKAKFDLSKGVPFGWQLLRGKRARRFLKQAWREEARYQRREAIRRAAGGNN